MLDSIDTAEAVGNDFSAKKLKDEISKMEKNLNRTVKQAERDRMRVDGKLQALRGDGNKEWIDFEDLGVDMLFIERRTSTKTSPSPPRSACPAWTSPPRRNARTCSTSASTCARRDMEATSCSRPARRCPTPWPNCTTCNAISRPTYSEQGVAAFTSWANTYGSIVESVEVKPEAADTRSTTVREIPQPARTDEHVPRLRGPADRRQA